MKKFCLHSKSVCAKRLFPCQMWKAVGKFSWKDFIFINSVKEFETYYTLIPCGRGCLLLFCLFLLLLYRCFAPVAFVMLSSWTSVIFPLFPPVHHKWRPVRNLLTSPVKWCQLRDKSGLYRFYLVAVNVIFPRVTFVNCDHDCFVATAFRHAMYFIRQSQEICLSLIMVFVRNKLS